MGVPFADIRSMIVSGFKSSFQPFHERQALLRKVSQELSRYDDAGVLREAGATSDPVERLRGSADVVASAE
jgi:hypothetical protein